MELCEKWIWLDEVRYKDYRNTVYSGFSDKKEECGNYAVAEFFKEYKFEKEVDKINLFVSGDTEFCLYINGKAAITGPIPVGGDFLFNDEARPSHYASTLSADIGGKTAAFFATVKLMPVKICEYSSGHGGFMLSGEVVFSDGSKTYISTDKTWCARRNGAYEKPYYYDGLKSADEFSHAAEIQNIWHCKTLPLAARTEVFLTPENGGRLLLAPFEKKSFVFEFEKIYAAFLSFKNGSPSPVKLSVRCFETDEEGTKETVILKGFSSYRGIELHSIGGLFIEAENLGNEPCTVDVGIINTFYPVFNESKTRLSDSELNDVLDVCAHTLKQCRQLIHLDSPRHCEPLACTGDYYIESLMTAFSFGDMSLAKADILRTAELLRYHGGRMFHTTYSLIWVLMLYDVYMLTGDKSLLENTLDALVMLIERFKTYLGDNGLIETPPDYMFIDWIYTDGISLHHPPKALGQTCLNIYFFAMLKTAEKILGELCESALEADVKNLSESIKKAVNTLLYDSEKALYFEGLNTPTDEKLLAYYMPQNTAKRYYRKHANILAACFGICDESTARRLIKEAFENDSLGDFQPYFAHFLFEAIFKNGLRDEYTLKLSERWKEPVKKCKKGLVEGFIAPEPTYSFDHSHAWGGSPLYSVPKALSGLEILEPGFKKIRLSPSLLGLKFADVCIPTPFGEIKIKLEREKEPVYDIPKEIEVIF